VRATAHLSDDEVIAHLRRIQAIERGIGGIDERPG
jgi:hypothetical protein